MAARLLKHLLGTEFARQIASGNWRAAATHRTGYATNYETDMCGEYGGSSERGRRWSIVKTSGMTTKPLFGSRRKERFELGHVVNGAQLVGQLLQMQRHIEAERLRGLEVSHQFEFGGCLNRQQLAWFCALEDAIDIRRRTPVLIGNIRALRDQAADFRE
jgi:hypothetical protein